MHCPIRNDTLAMDDDLGITWKETDVAHFLEKNHANHEISQSE
jgi:hypothetical protein